MKKEAQRPLVRSRPSEDDSRPRAGRPDEKTRSATGRAVEKSVKAISGWDAKVATRRAPRRSRPSLAQLTANGVPPALLSVDS